MDLLEIDLGLDICFVFPMDAALLLVLDSTLWAICSLFCFVVAYLTYIEYGLSPAGGAVS
jgi:hypothetical protein